ncbi:NmrA family protein [Sinorhizobium medicae]|uniref:NmrA family protein n=1 Tax=Sinorhizobium medicae TaxID=110321 RepID=A0A508X7W6_9HYPH|nr:NmrA/HSCARG family protein [Sinorhizobium medicae]PLT91006.1 NmrA family protein [Sinorhizobium medicae]PLU00495.1 NmrA family protein [Sinorhizobium medicae]PLU12108.1 NmrA family protein [Sinorhizobium medicae]PLU16618.1 NmrA family protein [Sinorhizobium medicae]PLU30404.1 NmrA family protein [Sinorhizobium medicae]
MAQSAEFLVFGATGQQGGAVARALKAKRKKVRAFVRDPESVKSKALAAEGISLAIGDLFDHASINQAMAGIVGVFSVQTSSPAGEVTDAQEVWQGKAIAESALRQGVRHLVYSSGGAAGKGTTGMGHFDSKSEIEAYVRGLPIMSTITRPASFMEMMLLPGMGLPQGEFTFFMRPEQSMQMIAVNDLGRINAEILVAPDHYAGKTIELASASVTGKDLERAFTAAAGRMITYRRFSDDLLAQNSFLNHLCELLDTGLLAGAADIPALDREFGHLTSLEEWLGGPGKSLFEAALVDDTAEVALR